MKNKIPGSDLEREKIFIPTLVGRDLLSTVRARGALYIRGGSELEEDRLKVPRIGMEKFALWRYLSLQNQCVVNSKMCCNAGTTRCYIVLRSDNICRIICVLYNILYYL